MFHLTRAHLTDFTLDERAVESFLLESPILSRRALKQTPKFGESRATTLPDSLRSTHDAYTLLPVKVPDIPTPPFPTLEEMLYFHLSVTLNAPLTVG